MQTVRFVNKQSDKALHQKGENIIYSYGNNKLAGVTPVTKREQRGDTDKIDQKV